MKQNYSWWGETRYDFQNHTLREISFYDKVIEEVKEQGKHPYICKMNAVVRKMDNDRYEFIDIFDNENDAKQEAFERNFDLASTYGFDSISSAITIREREKLLKPKLLQDLTMKDVTAYTADDKSVKVMIGFENNFPLAHTVPLAHTIAKKYNMDVVYLEKDNKEMIYKIIPPVHDKHIAYLIGLTVKHC